MCIRAHIIKCNCRQLSKRFAFLWQKLKRLETFDCSDINFSEKVAKKCSLDGRTSLNCRFRAHFRFLMETFRRRSFPLRTWCELLRLNLSWLNVEALKIDNSHQVAICSLCHDFCGFVWRLWLNSRFWATQPFSVSQMQLFDYPQIVFNFHYFWDCESFLGTTSMEALRKFNHQKGKIYFYVSIQS